MAVALRTRQGPSSLRIRATPTSAATYAIRVKGPISGCHPSQLRDQVAALECGENQRVPHEVEPLRAVGFSDEFLIVDRAGQPDEHGERRAAHPRDPGERGGDPACWAGLVCPECGSIVGGGDHRAGCPGAGTTR